MAKFIINSTGDKALRKDKVQQLEIVQIPLNTNPETYKYNLSIKMEVASYIGYLGIVFETDPTLEGISAKAATLLAALEL